MQELALSINGTPIPAPSGIPTGGLASFETFSQGLFTILIIISVILSLFFLIFGGIKWTMSGGDKEAVDSARKMITFAIVGLVVVFLTATIMNLIGGFFGLTLLGGNTRAAEERQQELDCIKRGICPRSVGPSGTPKPSPVCESWRRAIGDCE